jgi:hypothetical protein
MQEEGGPVVRRIMPRRKGRVARWLFAAVIGMAVCIAGYGLARQMGWISLVAARYLQGSVEVVLLDESGSPLSGSFTVGGTRYSTNSQGTTVLSLAVQNHTVRVALDGYQPHEQSVEVRWHQPQLIRITLKQQQKNPLMVRGFVQGYLSNSGLVGVTVRMGSRETKTDPSGAFIFLDVAPGAIQLVLSKESFTEKEVSGTLSSSDLSFANIEMLPQGTVYYLSKESGEARVYKAGLDGVGSPVTTGSGYQEAGLVSAPFGERAYFTSNQESTRKDNDGFLPYVVQGGVSHLIANITVAPYHRPVWSENGKAVAVTGFDSTGAEQHMVYSLENRQSLTVGEPVELRSFSPSGDIFAYTSTSYEDTTNTTTQTDGTSLTTVERLPYRLLRTLNIRTGERKTLSKQQGQISNIRFTGETAISFDVTHTSKRRLQVQVLSGQEDEVPLQAPETRGYVTSPSGHQRALIEQRNGGWDVFVVSLDGTGERQLSQGGVDATMSPVWISDSYVQYAIQKGSEQQVVVAHTQSSVFRSIHSYSK